MIGLILGAIIVFMVGLTIGYLVSVKMIGKQAAKRQLLDILPLMVFIYAIAVDLSFRASPYKDIVFPGGYALCLLVWLLSWPIRKQPAGRLLLNAGKLPQKKFLIWFGLIEAALAFSLSWDAIARWPLPSESLVSTVSFLVAIWLLAAFMFALGMSKLEFREKGICYLFRYLDWDRIYACQWDPYKPTMLTIQYKPRFPFLSKFLTIKLPATHRDEIERIAAEKISDNRLSVSV